LRDLAAGAHAISAPSAELFADSVTATDRLGAARGGQTLANTPPHTALPEEALLASPAHLFDCASQTDLPGRPLQTAEQAGEAGAAIAAATAKVAAFYAMLGRPSVDRQGRPVVSSVNYGEKFQNAFWSGQMMVYGNGDQSVFLDFWKAQDVICHEITHGITEQESGLTYHGESGAVNESVSDCFAAVFNQWANGLEARDLSGWRLGAAILGPAATAKSFTCMRDLARPNGSYCLAPQVNVYPNIEATSDVHVSSGVPNLAFSSFARAVGGNAWDAPIRIWYAACTAQGLKPDATISDFAAATMRAVAAWPGPDAAAMTAQLAAAWVRVEVKPADG
jgi:Zn-dependent metalloprotease